MVNWKGEKEINYFNEKRYESEEYNLLENGSPLDIVVIINVEF